MPTYGFVIDNRKCIGCHACTVACKSEHQVPLGVDRTWVKYIEKGTFPNSRRLFTVMRCNHCEWAPCVTICPVTALYQRQDGIVDFNPDRCIGCKSCLQACPYDALYIDPDTHTAAKCNFCTHRLEIGLQPSCVVVCPEQAIIAGDLDDPTSEIAHLRSRHPVQVRKPEKETRPKLFYIEADEAALVPTRADAAGRGMWSRGDFVTTAGAPATPSLRASSSLTEEDGSKGVASRRQPLPILSAPPKRAYDVRPRAPAWGWQVVAYTWTKSIAAGSWLAVLAADLLSGQEAADRISVWMASVALLFLVLTAALLIGDLKRPARFLYVLLRPQWRSWLVRGAYVLTAYGGLLTAWLLAHLLGVSGVANVLLWPGGVLAVAAAVYTALLFAQAKGRDFWQNPLLSLHLLAHALLAGGAVWLLADLALGGAASEVPRRFLAGTLLFSLLALAAEHWTLPPTTDARLALEWITGPMGRRYWVGGLGLGHLLPFALLLIGGAATSVAAALLALAGLYVIEALWVEAPQRIPLS
jgi:Fe-S-cluster-containing dehydrogenase component/formate-dependent nitrite reductase membrane component NrfD